ncbi:trypsin-like peptidase domain-containing protein [Arthrobacter sp. UNC362MFTsu5.1]|jgi:putative serine protease PepD|uniref:trypsin-like peptidase domain-containing protein n=1 Tax=Arthrobacter sp. UNC362MFTsu5.1 TaxID=1449044 RepID=UPI0005BA43E0|nr:trypsin-like peptidase domain-containing protein [Arthrobacter sp. UNC362MFTsu5.1]
MTENPAQGGSPENRGPEKPREGWPAQPAHADTQPLDAGHQQQPALQPQAPAQPAGDSVQGNSDTQGTPGAQGNPGAQDNPTVRLDRAPSDDGSAPFRNGQPHPHGDGAPQPVYPQHQPFYGQQAGPSAQHSGQPDAHQGHSNYSGAGAPQGSGPYQAGHQHPGSMYASDPASTPKRKAAFGVGTLVASILAAGLVGGGVVAASDAFISNGSTSAVSSAGGQPSTVIVNNKDDVNVITAASLKASPSVVTIKATSGSDGGTGSGIILDEDGHILTNTHVVTLDGKTANATIEIRTSDGRVLTAKIVGTDPLSDLAVIKVDNPSGLTPATLGDSGKLNVGDTAIAIGSPLGLTGTVTDGIVSTLNRTISVASSAAPKEGADDSQSDGEGGFQFAPPDGGQTQNSANQGSISLNVIQTDAAINPGNSGGALVNSKGEVIGVNVAIASAGGESSSSTSGNIGVGFSVPINNAKRVAQEIIDNGKATHGQFGVSVKPKSSTSSSSSFSVGAEVATVESGSAAAKAGLKVGDVVTKFNDLVISDPNQLTAAVREQPAGATVKVTFQRGGQQQQVDVTLGAAAEQ